MAFHCNNETGLCFNEGQLVEEFCGELAAELEELRNHTGCDCDESRVANLAAVLLVLFLGAVCAILAYKLYDVTRRDALRISDIDSLADDL